MTLQEKIDTLNAEINAREEQVQDARDLREEIPKLFEELKQAIERSETTAQKVSLLKALDELIYGRSVSESDRGPQSWRDYHLRTCIQLRAAEENRGESETEIEASRIPDYLYVLLNSAPLDSETFEKEITPKAQRLLNTAIAHLQTPGLPSEQRALLTAAISSTRPLIPLD